MTKRYIFNTFYACFTFQEIRIILVPRVSLSFGQQANCLLFALALSISISSNSRVQKFRCCLAMPWSASQRQRLGFEKDLLEKYFGNRVTWIDPTGDTKIEVRVTCSNDKQYTLRVYLPADYPNSVPEMIVKTPSMCTLTRRDGSDLVGSPDHVYGTKDGCTMICHFKPNLWRSDNTLYQVVMKGLIWLEAYQAHLRTGSNLSAYLCEMN